MKTFLLMVLTFILCLGCSSAINNDTLKNSELFISSDHKIITNEKIVRLVVDKLLKNELDSKELTSNLDKNTWVYAVQSTLRWPNKIDIKLKEHQPLAKWKDQGYLTHSGLIITPKETSIELDLVTLVGLEQKKFKLLELSRKIQSQLNRLGTTLVKVTLNQEGYLIATTIKGINLVFSLKDFRDQLERLENFISFELVSGKLNNIKNMDFRYKNGISVSFH